MPEQRPDAIEKTKETAGADEATPSKSEYFSWINNTNEGATEAQTLVNLAFFEWLQREYGMVLDIYAFDAGAIDGPRNYYGSLDSEKFKRQFPRGWDPIVKKARSIGTRLGVWGGPDGFGTTDDDARKRVDLMARLCWDYNLALFKFDGVCGTLRPGKQDWFVRMMQDCRKHSPDLILLNHRLDFGKGMPYATTSLLEGLETYIDVFLTNNFPATHNRAGALGRTTPPGLIRLQEDHGVCLSSCLDFWDDDLVLQAFNRALILSPQIYGNPWFLRDDEFPKLARIFNLHRQYREILVHAKPLTDTRKYGPLALSRGDARTRFITLRNLEWEPETYTITLSDEIGLDPTPCTIIVKQFHPTERVIGEFKYGVDINVVVSPFRSCLIAASTKDAWFPLNQPGITGTDFQVVRDVPGKSLVMIVLGKPGTTVKVSVANVGGRFSRARMDGKECNELARGNAIDVLFPGPPLAHPWHRKLATLAPCDVPADVEALYEATCFAANNNCLEVRCIDRSGPTLIREVRAARDAFFDQNIFKARGVWDRYAFDGNPETRVYTMSYPEAALRIDLGEPLAIDALLIKGSGDDLERDELVMDASADLHHWKQFKAPVHDCDAPAGDEVIETNKHVAAPEFETVPFDPRHHEAFFGESRFPFPVGKQRYVEFSLDGHPVKYIRLHGVPLHVLDVAARKGGTWIDDLSRWRLNYLFERLHYSPVEMALHARVVLHEIAAGSFLCVPIFGVHGEEGAYASFKIDGMPVGAPDRAPSYNGHAWEAAIRVSASNYTYYLPLVQDYVNKPIDVYVLGLKGNPHDFDAEVWITVRGPPLVSKELVLE